MEQILVLMQSAHRRHEVPVKQTAQSIKNEHDCVAGHRCPSHLRGSEIFKCWWYLVHSEIMSYTITVNLNKFLCRFWRMSIVRINQQNTVDDLVHSASIQQKIRSLHQEQLITKHTAECLPADVKRCTAGNISVCVCLQTNKCSKEFSKTRTKISHRCRL